LLNGIVVNDIGLTGSKPKAHTEEGAADAQRVAHLPNRLERCRACSRTSKR
jgi:hypothetical protein